GTGPALAQSVLPFGDGSTSSVPAGIRSSEVGESEYSDRDRRGDSPFGRQGRTKAPFATAISTAVEKESTSTTTTASLIGHSSSSPCKPHSQRRSDSAWSKSMTTGSAPRGEALCPP